MRYRHSNANGAFRGKRISLEEEVREGTMIKEAAPINEK